MEKPTIFIASLTGSLSVLADMPIFIIFGGVFIVVLLELKKIEKKLLPILLNLYGSVVVGWASSFGVKHFYPKLMQGDVKIFTMLITTLFAYGTVLYIVKTDTVGKWIDKFVNKKIDNNEDNSNN